MKEQDCQPLRQAIVAVLENSRLKVLLCPEDRTQMAVAKEMIYDSFRNLRSRESFGGNSIGWPMKRSARTEAKTADDRVNDAEQNVGGTMADSSGSPEKHRDDGLCGPQGDQHRNDDRVLS